LTGKQPLVSIVILNYNGLKFLKDVFDSLLEGSYPNLEIIMVDNRSSDESVEFVQRHYPEVIIHQNPENYKYARGNNEGIKISKGKYICLLNNDVKVSPGFVEPIIDYFENDPKVGAAQPKILDFSNRINLEYAGACGGYLDWLGYPFLRGRLFNITERDSGQYDEPLQIFWASGACIFFRAATLHEVGSLDESFELHMEEIDLCWRLHLTGWKIVSVPQSVIWHHGGGTLSQFSPQKVYYNFRNNIFTVIKNFSTLNLIIRLPLRFLLDIIALLRSLAILQFAMGLAIAKGYLWLLFHIPILWVHRRQSQAKRIMMEREVLNTMYPGSIVLEFFVLKRQRFSDLLFFKKFMSRLRRKKIILKNN
jgi:GT2 family glycosyltransferase